MRDINIIFSKLRIVFFANVANPDVRKYMEDCFVTISSVIHRGYLGSFDYWHRNSYAYGTYFV